MKELNRVALHVALKIDQKIAAGDQVEAGKRGVGEHVVGGKHNEIAHFLTNPIGAILFVEKSLEAVGCDVGLDVAGVEALASLFERAGVHIGSEDLELWGGIAAAGFLQ